MTTIAAVTSLAESNINPLSGTPIVGGYQLLGDGTESVCLTQQDNPLENDIYEVPAGGGAWVRRSDFDEVAERVPFTEFWVRFGDRARTKWYLWNIEPPEPGVDAPYFQMVSRGAPEEVGGGLERSGTLIQLQNRGLEGIWQLPTIETDQYGLPLSIESGNLGGGFIEGLPLRWVSDTQVAVDPGAAYIPEYNKIVELTATETLDQLTGVNAMYYAYLYEANGVGRIELSTTEPSEPYFGSARTMLGDDTRRYLGMLRNDPDGDVISFEDEILGGSTVLRIYGAGQDTDTVAAWNGISSSTTRTLRSIGPSATNAADRLVPASCRVAVILLQKAGAVTLRVGWPIDPRYNLAPITMQSSLAELRPGPVRLSPDQELYHQTSTGTATTFLFVNAYYDRR